MKSTVALLLLAVLGIAIVEGSDLRKIHSLHKTVSEFAKRASFEVQKAKAAAEASQYIEAGATGSATGSDVVTGSDVATGSEVLTGSEAITGFDATGSAATGDINVATGDVTTGTEPATTGAFVGAESVYMQVVNPVSSNCRTLFVSVLNILTVAEEQTVLMKCNVLPIQTTNSVIEFEISFSSGFVRRPMDLANELVNMIEAKDSRIAKLIGTVSVYKMYHSGPVPQSTTAIPSTPLRPIDLDGDDEQSDSMWSATTFFYSTVGFAIVLALVMLNVIYRRRVSVRDLRQYTALRSDVESVRN